MKYNQEGLNQQGEVATFTTPDYQSNRRVRDHGELPRSFNLRPDIF